MANNKNPNQKQPGEKEPGKFHYNPGNMSGKIIGATKDGQQTAKPLEGGQQNDDKPGQQTKK